MRRLAFIMVACFCISFIPLDAPALEIKALNVQTEEWKDCTEKDGTGLYFDILREVFKPKGIQLIYKIVPYKRSVHNVKNGRIDVAIGAYPQEVQNVIYPKWHFFVDDVSAVFFKPNGSKCT